MFDFSDLFYVRRVLRSLGMNKRLYFNLNNSGVREVIHIIMIKGF